VYEYIAVVRSVHDGDTFKADIDLGFGIWFSNQTFRLLGIQAWELKEEGGPAARDELARLMPIGSEILIRTKKDSKEKFGRYLATVLSHGGDVATALVAGGHAVFWDGHGPRPENPNPHPAELPRQMIVGAYPRTVYDLPDAG
jgi:micrococcal nuclease